MPDREEQLLDAAIDVLAQAGARRLTHRAVDLEAALPAGSASNRFRSREALLSGVLRRLLEREAALWNRFMVGQDLSTIDNFAEALGRLVDELSGPDSGLTQARYAVVTQAELPFELHIELARAREQIGAWMQPTLVRLGCRDACIQLTYLLALLDGLLLARLTQPPPHPPSDVAIAGLLHGLIG